MAWRTRSVKAGTSSELNPVVGMGGKIWTVQRPEEEEKKKRVREAGQEAAGRGTDILT